MILKIFLGATPVQKVYSGSTLIGILSLGNYLSNEYNYADKTQFSNKLLYSTMYKKKQ